MVSSNCSHHRKSLEYQPLYDTITEEDANLKPKVVRADQLSPSLQAEIYSLCNRAFEEDLTPIFSTFKDATHVLGYLETILVSHAMWVPRWLQVRTNPVMRTAYIEAVATEKVYQACGFAATIMKHVAEEIQDFELGALSPFSVAFYERLGWALWHYPQLSEPMKVFCTPQEMET